MKPLLAFIAKIRAWHILLVAAFALIFVIVAEVTDTGTFSPAVSLQLTIHSLVAIPVMFLTLAFLIFALTTTEFGARALFPSIVIVIGTFSVVALIGDAIADPDFPYLIFGTLGLVATLMMSGLVCAMIAIRRNRRGR